MDELIKEAISKYSSENHGRPVSDDIRDTITWLIKHKADTDGMEGAKKYVHGSGLWDDLIAIKLRGSK